MALRGTWYKRRQWLKTRGYSWMWHGRYHCLYVVDSHESGCCFRGGSLRVALLLLTWWGCRSWLTVLYIHKDSTQPYVVHKSSWGWRKVRPYTKQGSKYRRTLLARSPNNASSSAKYSLWKELRSNYMGIASAEDWWDFDEPQNTNIDLELHTLALIATLYKGLEESPRPTASFSSQFIIFTNSFILISIHHLDQPLHSHLNITCRKPPYPQNLSDLSSFSLVSSLFKHLIFNTNHHVNHQNVLPKDYCPHCPLRCVRLCHP